MAAVAMEPDADYLQVIAVICRRLALPLEHVDELPALFHRAAAASSSVVIVDSAALGGPAEVARLRGVTAAQLIVLDAGGRPEEYLEAGADHHVTKPFAPSLLRATAMAALRRASQLSPLPLERRRLGAASFEPARRRLSGGVRRVTLTAREGDLLEFLAVNVGQVVTRSQIVEGAWGGVAEATDAAVVSAVYRLRRKLQLAGAGATILTEPGLGYRLRVEPAGDALELTGTYDPSRPPSRPRIASEWG